MAGVGTFEKCRYKIDVGIKTCLRLGIPYMDLDLPYLTKSDQSETDRYIQQLEDRGFRLEIKTSDTSKNGYVYFQNR